MRTGTAALALALVALPAIAAARGGHRAAFAVHHGHPINSWMGSHHRHAH